MDERDAWDALWEEIDHRMSAGEKVIDIWLDVKGSGVTLDQLVTWRMKYYKRPEKLGTQMGLMLSGRSSRR